MQPKHSKLAVHLAVNGPEGERLVWINRKWGECLKELSELSKAPYNPAIQLEVIETRQILKDIMSALCQERDAIIARHEPMADEQNRRLKEERREVEEMAARIVAPFGD